MNQPDFIVSAPWILCMDAARSILQDHGVAVANGEIIGVDPILELEQRYPQCRHTRLSDHVLMPGLVNAHTHAAMTLLRGYADDLPLMKWLTQHIWPAEGKWVNEEFICVGTDLAIAEMILGGTTCFNDMYFFPDLVAERAVSAGMRANIGMIVLEMPTRWAQDSSQYLEKGLAIHDQFRNQSLINTSFAPHAPYTVEDESLKRIQTLADELDVQIHIHVHETAHEIEESLSRFGIRPLERLANLGLTTPRMQAVHMTQLLKDEIRFCANEGVNVIHCPQSNLKLCSGTCPVSDLVEAGVNVAIGTDGAASNNDLDMLEETRSTALLAKLAGGSPEAIPAGEALAMATINGARSLGIDHLTGSLETGKQADMIAIDLNHPRTQPLYHPEAQVAYSASSDQVSDVWIAGRQVLKNRQHSSIDLDRTLQLADEWRQRIQTTPSDN